MALYRSRSADIDADGSAVCRTSMTSWLNSTSTFGEPLHPLQKKTCGLELLALNNKRMPSILRKDRMIELRHKSIGRPVPKLKDRRDQSYPRHILIQAVFGEQIERCGMRRGRARVGLQASLSSNRRTGMPWLPKRQAHSRPTGPPPAISTLLFSSDMSRAQVSAHRTQEISEFAKDDARRFGGMPQCARAWRFPLRRNHDRGWRRKWLRAALGSCDGGPAW